LKTDTEIKDWIDEREVLTQSELSMFIYGYKKASCHRHWDYVLETKNIKSLKEYKNYVYANRPLMTHRHKEIICDILKVNSGVIKKWGARRIVKWFKEIYNIDVGRTTIKKYRNLLGISNPINEQLKIYKIFLDDKRVQGKFGARNFKKIFNITILPSTISRWRAKHICYNYITSSKSPKLLKIISGDIRFGENGTRRGLKLLENVYGIKISNHTLINYKKEILNQTITKC